ncbi:TPA: heme ABC transporter ATP-binding protein [Candidatus Bipolaricaulota bacterium]|nr:heme ABC transporter ATP-binding protein [Candidatus Bipolaricaulota bacterium]
MKVRIRGLAAGYRGRPVLAEVSLDLPPGELLAVVGPNGAGKTTLLRAISGALPPSAGAVYLDGKELGRLPPREVARRLAVVEQRPQVGFDFTVRQLVELGRLPHLRFPDRLTPRDAEAVERALAAVGLAEHEGRRFSTLSGGEKQRVFLAVALAQEPRVLLLDEPTAHLDVRHQLELMELVAGRAREGLAVLAAMHDLNLAAAFADRMALLVQGRVLAQGPPEEVLTRDNLRAAFGVEARVERDETGTVHIRFLPQRSRGKVA